MKNSLGWFRRFIHRRKMEVQLDKELRFHFDRMVADLASAGVAPEEAHRRAVLEFGGLTQLKEECRDARGTRLIEDFFSDVTYTLRTLRHNPGFAAIAIVSLALGLGANTALFSVVDAVLVKSLPVRDPERLRIFTWLRTPKLSPRMHSGYGMEDDAGRHVDGSFSYPTYLAFRDNLPQFSDVVAFAPGPFTVTDGGTSDAVSGHYVSANYFEALGVSPLAGRTISSADDGPGMPRVVVITYHYWNTRFGLDPTVLGRTILVNHKPSTVIGILRPAFQGLIPGRAVDLMVQMSTLRDTPARFSYSLTDDDHWWVQVCARLKPGVGEAAAAEAARSVLARQIEAHKEMPGVPQIVLEPGMRGVGLLRGSLRKTLYILAGIMAIVLLIACVNMANLLLARSAARAREVAIRISIGAGRGRLIRQMLTESLLLSGTGGLAGLLIAEPMRRLLLRLGSGTATLVVDSSLDLRALAFTFAVSVLTGLLFGVLPALRFSRSDVSSGLKDGGGAAGGRASRHLAGRLLVSAQIALSLLLLTGAGLFVRTLLQLGAVDLGFQAENLLLFQTDPGRVGYKGDQVDHVTDRLREELSAIPGVESVGLSHQPLITGSETDGPVFFAGSKKRNSTLFLYCSESFLPTSGIPIVLGRGLTARDVQGRIGSTVVNEAFVHQYLKDQSPLGMTFRQSEPNGELFTIVGVARNAHYDRVRGEADPTAYMPYGARPPSITDAAFVIRTRVAPATMAAIVRRTVGKVDQTLPVAEMRTEQEQIDRSLTKERLFAGLVGMFAAMAAVLAAIGLYGVMAYSVSRRTAEIGIRMALGARRRDVQWLVVRQALAMVAAGIAVGVPTAFALTGVLRSMLYEVKPGDPVSFGAAAGALALIAALAAWVPVRRASQVEPLVALRHD